MGDPIDGNVNFFLEGGGLGLSVIFHSHPSPYSLSLLKSLHCFQCLSRNAITFNHLIFCCTQYLAVFLSQNFFIFSPIFYDSKRSI